MSVAGLMRAAPLGEEDGLLRALEMIDEAASLSTPEGVLAYLNPVAERLFGYASGELVGQHVSALNAYSPEANARIVSAVIAALMEHGRWSGEWINKRRDGTPFVTSSTISTVSWAGRTHWLCIQRPASFSQGESQRLALAAEAAQLGIWEWDVPSNTFVYSARAREICGFGPDGEVGYEDVVRVTHPEDFPRTWAQAQRSLDPRVRERMPFEYRIVRPDGSLRWVRAFGYAVFSEEAPEPRALKYVGTLEDITDQVLARRSQAESARQVSLALESARMAIWSLDIRNVRLEPSAEFNRLFGFAPDAAPSVEQVEACYAPGVRGELEAIWAEATARRQPSLEVEYAIIRRDGARRWMHVRCDIQYGAEGAPDRAIGVIMDVTDRRRDQDALHESEQRFRGAADSAPAPIWMTNAAGKIEFVNKALCDFAGVAADELLGDVWMTALHPDDVAGVVAVRREAWDAGCVPYTFEARFRRADGKWRWLVANSNPRRDADGAFCGYVGLAVDRTDELEAIAVLRESEQRFRMLADSAPVMIWMSDVDGRCLYLNAALRGFWGVAEEELSAFDWRQMMHPEDEPRVSGVVAAALSSMKAFSVQGRYRDAEGRFRVVTTRGEPRLGADGAFLGMIGVNVDVTEIVLAQEALHESRQRLQRVADSAPAMIWTADAGGELTFHNEQWRSYTGALGNGHWLASRMHPEDADACMALWRASLAAGTPVEFEARFGRHDGQFRWFLVRARPVRDASREVVEWAGSAADIHDRKLFEQRQKLLLDELNHRVKNTLTVVQSLALQTFRNTPDPAEARQAFDGRLGALAAAHTLLTKSNWQSAELSSVIEEAARVCGGASSRISHSGPPLVLSPKQALSVAMLLHELCTNAIKYGALSTAEGRVDLRWDFVRESTLEVTWVEYGGPPVETPVTRGFGSNLLERAVVHDLGGHARICFDRDGLRYTLQLPVQDPE